MKLKFIAAAALIAASAAGSANAAIDTGNTGNGDLFISMWDGATSYTRDLNVKIDDFQAGIAAAGDFVSVFDLSADSVFSSYISGANLAALQWNIVAADVVGARRIIDTYSTMPATTLTADLIRSTGLAIGSFATAVNQGMTAQGTTDSAVFNAATPGYAANTTGIRFGANNGGLMNFNTTGTLANNSYATGLGMLRIDGAASGVAKSTYTAYADGGNAIRAYLDGGQLTITSAPVPEPETYAMLLAGLGLMGAIARRRRNQA